MYRIFIVEDDPVIAEAMRAHLAKWDFDARAAGNFRDVMAEFSAFQPHLTLMDITLPFFSGYHWCAQIRRVSKTPVMFVSSASDNMNIVMAVNMGGDDFIAKPFDLEVLSAKVQAMLRRSYDYVGMDGLIECRGAILNTHDQTLTYRDARVELTRNEYRILEVLLENKGGVVGREALMARLWETDSYVDENTLAVNVARLRKKLDAAGLEDMIVTKRKEGYMAK
jgi:two-component system response regulator protein BraR/BceR